MQSRVRFLTNVLLAGLAVALVPLAASASSEQVLYNFQGGQDGANPVSTPIDVDGILYGTTLEGGGSCGCGTLYSVTPDGTETVLHQFAGGSDGLEPRGGLLNVDGVLYGTTQGGGKYNNGTVYRLLRDGTEQIVHSFEGAPTDGYNPDAGLINFNGVLYGTTIGGGTSNNGTIFALAQDGTETVIHSFIAAEGKNPEAPLLEMNGILYGTTYYGGSAHDGTVFSITPAGEFQVLHSFGTPRGDGAYPSAALINLNGVLYGTTELGGSHNWGSVYSITPAGTEAVLYSFPTTSGHPESSLLAVNGALLGTTNEQTQTDGTIYSVTTSGHGSLLFTFDGLDGANPYAGLVRAGNMLYGATDTGGTAGLGTVYSFTH